MVAVNNKQKITKTANHLLIKVVTVFDQTLMRNFQKGLITGMTRMAKRDKIVLISFNLFVGVLVGSPTRLLAQFLF